jgi:hypothetical protein
MPGAVPAKEDRLGRLAGINFALKGFQWRCSTTTIVVEKHQTHRRVRLTTSNSWLCLTMGHIVIPQ